MKSLILLFLLLAQPVQADQYEPPQINGFSDSSDSPRLYAPDGTFLGNVNENRYDPDSISNPYGRYGSPYSPESVNNPYGRYGSRYSSESVRYPYGR